MRVNNIICTGIFLLSIPRSLIQYLPEYQGVGPQQFIRIKAALKSRSESLMFLHKVMVSKDTPRGLVKEDYFVIILGCYFSIKTYVVTRRFL